MLSCKEFTHQSSRMVDNEELTFMEKLNSRIHMFMCKHCRHYHNQSELVASVAKHLDCGDAPDQEIDQAVAQMKKFSDNPTD